MTVAVAASLLLAGAIGGGSLLSFQLYRHQQRADAERAVSDALATAVALKGAAERAGPAAVADWKQVLDAVEMAEYTITLRPSSPGLARDVATIHDEIATSEAAAREVVRGSEGHRRFVAALDEAILAGAAVN